MAPRWEESFRRLHDEAVRRGRVAAREAGPERRAEPRYRMERTEITARTAPDRFALMEVSPGGLTYRSRTAMVLGERVTVSLKDYLSVEVTVAGCDIVEVDADMMEYAYHVRCLYTDREAGRMLTAVALELEFGTGASLRLIEAG